MLLLAVAMKPFEGLMRRGSSFRNPSHSYLPVPGTGSRPTQPLRFGVSADPWKLMLPSTSPQIRFSVGAFQYIASSRKLLQSFACDNRSPAMYAPVPGSFNADFNANA